MRADVPVFGFLADGNGFGDAFQLFLAGVPHPLVGFPGFFGTLLVDVVRGIGFLAVGLPLETGPESPGWGVELRQ